MKLYAIAACVLQDKEAWLGIYYCIASTEEEARTASITHFLSCHPDMFTIDKVLIEVAEIPIDDDMIPKVSSNIKARKFLEGIVSND